MPLSRTWKSAPPVYTFVMWLLATLTVNGKDQRGQTKTRRGHGSEVAHRLLVGLRLLSPSSELPEVAMCVPTSRMSLPMTRLR